MTDFPADILKAAQSITTKISNRMEASSTLGDAATEVIAEGLMAERERVATHCEERAIAAREDAVAHAIECDYTTANHWNGYAAGCDDVALAIRSGEQP